MTKRFELKVNQHNQCDIVDWVESKEKNAICIYNDLGNYYFSSAKALCGLLNELAEEIQDHKAMIEFLDTENTQIMNELKTRTQIQHQLEEENEQLKQLIKKTLETTPIEHTLAVELKNSVRELYD